MRRQLKAVGAVALAATAIGTSGALATSTAAAQEFTASSTGEVVEEGTTAQRFTSAPGSEVVCKRQIGVGTIIAIAFRVFEMIDDYSECVAFGFVGAKVSPVDYELNANGEVTIVKTVKIDVEGVCEVTVEPQTLSSASYSNVSGELEVDLSLTGIHSTTSNSLLCPAGSEGTYVGKKRAKLVEGTLEWVA